MAAKSHLERLTPETREMLEKSNAERIKFIEHARFIPYKTAKEILNKMEELLVLPKRDRMPSLLIVGTSNNGKTSIVKHFFRKHPPTEGIDEDAMPVVYVQAPYEPNVGMFYDKILEALIVPFKQSDPASKKEREIKYYFRHLGTKMLIVDEIHNILSGSVAKQRSFMNAVKNLNNELAIPIVLVGIKDALHAVSTDLQISSRFRPMVLPRWTFDKEYLLLLARLERTLPLKKPSNLAQNREVAELILDSSEGLIGEIVERVMEAAVMAVETGSEKIGANEIKQCDLSKPSERLSRNLLDVTM
jgi:type II secretory pathway predicted ATPase ExeA